MVRTGVFILWFLATLIFKLPSRYSFLSALFFVVISFLSKLLGIEGFAERVVSYYFGFLVIGLVLYLKEVKSK